MFIVYPYIHVYIYIHIHKYGYDLLRTISMCVPNLVPIGPQAATCIRPEGYTHTQTDTHTLSYIDIDIYIICKQIKYDSIINGNKKKSKKITIHNMHHENLTSKPTSLLMHLITYKKN